MLHELCARFRLLENELATEELEEGEWTAPAKREVCVHEIKREVCVHEIKREVCVHEIKREVCVHEIKREVCVHEITWINSAKRYFYRPSRGRNKGFLYCRLKLRVKRARTS